jgi:hypothetical protein
MFFLHLKKSGKIIKENYGGPLKCFQTQYKFGKLKKKLNEKNIILKRKFQFSNSGFSRKLEYCSVFKQPLNFILHQVMYQLKMSSDKN